MRFWIHAITTCLLISLATAAQRVPGTQVALTAPKGFTASSGFLGYEHAESGASIMVVEIPGPYEEAVKGLTAKSMEEKGMELVSSEEIKIGDHEGKLMKVNLMAGPAKYQKWLLIFGAEKTVTIHGTAPRERFDQLSDSLRACLLAAEWDPEVEVNILEGLAFDMEEAGELKFALKVGTGLVLTHNGIHPQKDVKLPMVVVTSSTSPEFKADADPKAYAHALLGQMQGVPEKRELAAEQAIEFGGSKGYLVSATGTPEGADAEIHYELSVVLEEGRLTMMYSRVAAASQKDYEPLFKQLRDSIQMK